MKKQVKTAQPPSSLVRGWVLGVARHVGLDTCEADALLPEEMHGWADMLAVLKRANAHALYSACQNRLQLTEEAIETATNARYAD